MKTSTFAVRALALLIAVPALEVACGGGGGGTSAPSNPAPVARAWSAPAKLDGLSIGPAGTDQVAADQRGNFTVLVGHSEQAVGRLYAYGYNAKTGTWSAPAKLQAASSTAAALTPSIRETPDGKILVAWLEVTDTQEEVWFNATGSDGGWIGATRLATSASATDFRVAQLPDGTACFCWREGSTFFASTSTDLANWKTGTLAQLASSWSAFDHQLVAGPDGTFYAVWEQESVGGSTKKVMMASIHPTNGISPAAWMNDGAIPGDTGEHPRLAFNAKGSGTLTWSQYSGTGFPRSSWGCYFRTLSPGAGWGTATSLPIYGGGASMVLPDTAAGFMTLGSSASRITATYYDGARPSAYQVQGQGSEGGSDATLAYDGNTYAIAFLRQSTQPGNGTFYPYLALYESDSWTLYPLGSQPAHDIGLVYAPNRTGLAIWKDAMTGTWVSLYR